MKRCGGLRKLFDANTLRSRPSALTAPGSGDIATSSKGCPCICQLNINWNGFWPSWLKRMSPPAPKIKPLIRSFPNCAQHANEASWTVHPPISSGQSSSSSEPPHPAALRAAGCGGTAFHQFHRWQICRSLGSALWPFPRRLRPRLGLASAGQGSRGV